MKPSNIDNWWIRYGTPTESSSFLGNQGGKYLFFSESQQVLKDLIEDEISNNGFEVAKVSRTPSRNDYVCCLYYGDDSKKWELKDKYENNPEIKYRYWKSNQDTRDGKYSKKHLEAIND